jgi:hypothetical protein
MIETLTGKACEATNRGAEVTLRGVSGIDDATYKCTYDGTSAYAWRQVAHLPADPGADRIAFWDDSAGEFAYLTPDATDLAISGTTLALGSAPSFTDFTNANHDHLDADDGGAISAVLSVGTLTIASGEITLPEVPITTAIIYVVLDTEAAAAADDLDIITVTGSVTNGTMLILRSTNAARVVTARHLGGGTGNISLDGGVSMALNSVTDSLTLYRRSVTSWTEISRID